MQINSVGVVGTGTMGSGIIEITARTGISVTAYDISPEALEAGRTRVFRSMDKALSRGKLDEATRDSAESAITWTMDYDDFGGCDLVVEAAPENLELKQDVFGRLDDVLGSDAIIATNTSSLSIIDIAMATSRPEQVLGMHFFNPATIMRLVEVIRTELTSESVATTASAFASETLGKRVVPTPDRAGFVVNRLLIPYVCAAIAMYEEGKVSAQDIDDAMRFGAAHPMGPLALADLIGTDVCLFTAESLYAEYGEPFYAPPPLLRRMVSAGRLGRKSGQGFYSY